MTTMAASAAGTRRNTGSRWVAGGSLYVRLTEYSVASGNIPIGTVGAEYFAKRFDDVFDIISEWGNEYAKRVAGAEPSREAPYVHLSKTFARRFRAGALVKFEKVGRTAARMSLVDEEPEAAV